MTLRARPVARRRGRAGWDPGDRRNSLINLGFFLAIGFSILLLVGYAAFSWYNDHFGAAATVNGVTITNDELRNRLRVETFRLGYFDSRITTLLANGRLTDLLHFVTQCFALPPCDTASVSPAPGLMQPMSLAKPCLYC